MFDDALIKEVLARALASGASFAEIFAERREAQTLRLDDRRLEEVSSGLDVGAGVRAVVGDQTGYAFTNVLTREGLLEAASAAAAAASGGASVSPVDLRRAEPPVVHLISEDPFEVPAATKADLLWRADDASRSQGEAIRQVTAFFGQSRQRVLICNSEGLRAEDLRTRVNLGAFVVAARNGDMQTAFESQNGTVGFELLKEHPPEEIAERAAKQAILKLEAIPSPAGEMPVVLGARAHGVLFHEACGHGCEADMIVKDTSVYAKLDGKKVAPDYVTVIDDATVPKAYGSFAFDDEGTPAQRTVLIDQGVLVSYLIDRLRGDKLGRPPTGNGRRQSYEHLPIPRMTNTFLPPGDAEPEEIIRDTKSGVWVGRLAGGQVNPVNGDFVFGVSEAHLIENGEITKPLRGVNLIGDGPTILKRIEVIGSDFEMGSGTCGKDGQAAPVGDGQPTLRISKLTVGGTG